MRASNFAVCRCFTSCCHWQMFRLSACHEIRLQLQRSGLSISRSVYVCRSVEQSAPGSAQNSPHTPNIHTQTSCTIAGPAYVTYTPPPPVYIISAAAAAAAAGMLLATICMLTAIYILFCLFIFPSFGTHLSSHSTFVAQPLFITAECFAHK